jgi:hypothetical protein
MLLGVLEVLDLAVSEADGARVAVEDESLVLHVDASSRVFP